MARIIFTCLWAIIGIFMLVSGIIMPEKLMIPSEDRVKYINKYNYIRYTRILFLFVGLAYNLIAFIIYNEIFSTKVISAFITVSVFIFIIMTKVIDKKTIEKKY